MKLFVLAATLFFAAAANAQVAVGTWASYNVKAVLEDGRSFAGQETMKVLAVNADGTSLIETTTVEDNGTTTTDQSLEKTEELMNEQIGAAVVAQCADPQIGGTVESVSVAAGTFQSCKLSDPDEAKNALWYGAVPFGVLKFTVLGQIEDNGKTQLIHLTKELAAHGTK